MSIFDSDELYDTSVARGFGQNDDAADDHMRAESKTTSEEWGASFRQNVVGMRSSQVEHTERNWFSTVVHDTFGIYDKPDYSFDKMGKEASDVKDSVPLAYRELLMEEENLADMTHKAAMINSDLDDEETMASVSMPAQFGMAFAAFPLDPLTYATFGIGAVGKVGTVMRKLYGPSTAHLGRKVAVTAGQGAIEGAVSEGLIKTASTEDYSGVPMSAAFSGVFAGGIHTAVGLVQRHGGALQREILEKMENGEMDIDTNRQNVLDNMKILDGSDVKASFNKILGIPVAKWMSKATANRVTGRWTSSDMNTILADSTTQKGKDAGAEGALVEIGRHDNTHIGLEDSKGNVLVQSKATVQDIKYEQMFHNIKLEMARQKGYKGYADKWEALTPQEKTATPKMNHEGWSQHMNSLRAKVFDDYNAAKTKHDFEIRRDDVQIEAAQLHAEKKIEEKVMEYNLKKLQKDKTYTILEKEDLDEVEWSQHMEDVFGGRDELTRFKEGWEESYYRNEASNRTDDPYKTEDYGLEPHEKEFMEASSAYYKGKSDMMKKNGLDEFDSFDPTHYAPRMWKASVMDADKPQAIKDIEQAIRDSPQFALELEALKNDMQEAIDFNMDNQAAKDELTEILADISEAKARIAELDAQKDELEADAIFDKTIENMPFRIDIDPTIDSIHNFGLGEVIRADFSGSVFHDAVGRIQGFVDADHAIILQGNGEISRVDMTTARAAPGDELDVFHQDLAKTRSRHEMDSPREMLTDEEMDYFPKDFFDKPTFVQLWNAAGRPKIKIKEDVDFKASNNGFVGGWYNRTTNGVEVTVRRRTKAEAAKTMMHELVHALTVNQLGIDPVFKKHIDELFVEAKAEAALKGYDTKDIYGFTNSKEMLSEMFSNPAFLDILTELESSGTHSSAGVPDSVFTNLIVEIMDMIKTLFNNNTKIAKNSSHQQILAVLHNIEHQTPMTATYKREVGTQADVDLKKALEIEHIADRLDEGTPESLMRITKSQWLRIEADLMQIRPKKYYDGYHEGLLEAVNKYNVDAVSRDWFDQEIATIHDDLKTVGTEFRREVDHLDIDELTADVMLYNGLNKKELGAADEKARLETEIESFQKEHDVLEEKLKDAPDAVKRTRGTYEDYKSMPKHSAKAMVNRVTAKEARTVSGAKMSGEVKMFGQRTMNISETHPAIQKYMHKNEASIQQMYDYKTNGRIATQDVFGTIKREEYEDYVRQNRTGNKRYVSMLGDMFDRGMGTKQLPPDMDDGFERFARVVANYNYLTMGGQFVKYGLAEMGATIHSVGLKAFMQGVPALKDMVGMYKRGEVPTAAQLSNIRLADAGEIYKGNNMAALGDATDIASTFAGEGTSKLDYIEGWSKKMSQWMFRGSGLEAATVWTKLVLPRAFMGRILDQVATGKLDRAAMQDMARWGLSAEDLVAVSKENWTHDVKSGMVDDFNLDNWHDKELSGRFERAVHRMSRDTIMRPDANRLPNWLTDGSVNPVVKMAKQFMSFMFVSHERLLMRGMNERQAQAAVAALVSFGFLAMFEAVGERVAIATGIMDEDDARYTSDDPEKFMGAMRHVAMLNSYAGLGPTAYEFGNLLFGQGFGNNSRTLGKVAGGPLLSKTNMGVRSAIDIVEGKYGTRDQMDFMRTSIPYNNLIGMDYAVKKGIFQEEQLVD